VFLEAGRYTVRLTTTDFFTLRSASRPAESATLGELWVDYLELVDEALPLAPLTWGRVKALYRE